MKISEYLDPNLVFFLDDTLRDQVLRSMIDRIDQADLLENKKAFLSAIIDREKIVTTGIGMKVAIPHAKLPGHETFFIAIARLKKEVEWGSLDEVPVRLVFMVGGPDDKQTEYLQILSSLTRTLKNESLRKQLIEAKTTEEIIDLLR